MVTRRAFLKQTIRCNTLTQKNVQGIPFSIVDSLSFHVSASRLRDVIPNQVHWIAGVIHRMQKTNLHKGPQEDSAFCIHTFESQLDTLHNVVADLLPPVLVAHCGPFRLHCWVCVPTM